jgi:hypothetical protein
MGQASQLEHQAQEAMVQAIIDGRFTYDELVKMFSNEVRFLSRQSIEEALDSIDMILGDIL